MDRYLSGEMSGCAEPIHPQPLTGAYPPQAQRPEADDPRAEQRRGSRVGKSVRDRDRELLMHQGVLGVATIDIVAREPSLIAQVLFTRQTIRASAAGGVQPGNSYAITSAEPVDPRSHGFDATHYLMPRHHRESVAGQLSFDDMQVGVAYPAGQDPQQQLSGTSDRLRHLEPGEGRAGDGSRRAKLMRNHLFVRNNGEH